MPTKLKTKPKCTCDSKDDYHENICNVFKAHKNKTTKVVKKVWAIFDHSVNPWIFHNAFSSKKLAREEIKMWGYYPKIVRCELHYKISLDKSKKK